jgi:DNA-binding transcriptional ArsR family regulator
MDKEILDIVADAPGIASVKVIEMLATGKSRRTVSRHVKDLQRKGLIDIFEVEGVRKLYISGEYGSALLSNEGIVDIAPARI